jgi:pyruvate/2-oxoglutarate dehydrogenase complex dihydrolipoamide dehydrogenase (E3) component
MYDLVVLGGGAGGQYVATAAAHVGAKVALIDKARPGMDGSLGAAIRSKTLLRAARMAHEVRCCAKYGIKTSAVDVDFAAVMSRVHSVATRFAAEESAEALRTRGIDVYLGTPAFEAYDTVVVNGQTRVNGHRFIIATGSRPVPPPIPGIIEAGYLDTSTIWNLDELPESLLILGATPAGLEIGQAFARLGSKVTFLVETGRVLPHADRDVSERLQSHLAGEGIAFHTNVEFTSAAIEEGKKVVKFRNKVTHDTFEAKRSHLLVVGHRAPNVEGLNLEVVGVHADAARGIEVDEHLQTHSPNILAIGDVIGRRPYLHSAEREASVAFQRAVLRLPKRIDYQTIPSVLFTDPEIAMVGMTEVTARAQDASARVVKVDYDAVDRARIDGRTVGFAKVIASPGGKILGAAIVGDDAATVLQELVLAMDHGLTLHDVAQTAHSYPSYSGLVRRLAVEFGSMRLERGFMQTALRWFYGFEPRKMHDDPHSGHTDPHSHPGHATH